LPNQRPTVARHDGGTRGGGKHRRQMRNFLLDKKLQLRYVAFVTLLSALLSSSLGYLIWRQEADASRTIVATFDSSELADDDGLKDAIVERLTSHEKNLVLTMVGAGAGLVVVLFLYLVVMTHKVAGPLFKVANYFDRMSEGKLGEVYSLRKGDMLQDFYQDFREMYDAVRGRHLEDNEIVGKFLAACDAAGVSNEGEVGEQLEKLRAHHAGRTEALS
jgi:hypothetical protein